jgi:hypothetical protein
MSPLALQSCALVEKDLPEDFRDRVGVYFSLTQSLVLCKAVVTEFASPMPEALKNLELGPWLPVWRAV